MKLLFKVWSFFDPATEGDAYQPLPRERKRKEADSIFSLRLRNRLAYRRY